MTQMTYITKCGCRLPASGTKRKKGYRRICKEHGGQILRAERKCLDCDEIIHLKHTGKGPFRCENHKRLHNAKKRHEVYVKASLKNKDYVPVVPQVTSPKWGLDPRGDYCTGLESCNMRGSLNCKTCVEFVGVFFGYDPAKIAC